MPLTVIAVVMVVLIGGLAAGTLFFLKRLHDRQARSKAAITVLDTGRAIATHLAAQPAVRGSDTDADAWGRLSELVRSLHTVENGLQYVSVLRDGVTVFNEQTTGLSPASADTAPPLPPGSQRVRLGRKRLSVGDDIIPVVTFTALLETADGQKGLVEVGVRRDTVKREEIIPAGTIFSMFRLSLVTVLVSFGMCVVVVVWMLRREQRREAQRREEEHLAFAGVMANGIVHDFRNPMSSLRLDLQMLQRETARGTARPDRLRELAGRAEHTVDRMDKVFQEFFYLSRPPDGERQKVDLAETVRETIGLMKPRLDQAGVEIRMTVPPDSTWVHAYPFSLRRALLNVLTNAEQFSSPGGHVDVSLSIDGKWVAVDVHDRGPGIPRASRRRVFDMFYSTRAGGTGLGLFLAKTAVERCGGNIRVVDRPGAGTAIRMSLPAAEPQEES